MYRVSLSEKMQRNIYIPYHSNILDTVVLSNLRRGTAASFLSLSLSPRSLFPFCLFPLSLPHTHTHSLSLLLSFILFLYREPAGRGQGESPGAAGGLFEGAADGEQEKDCI